MKLRSTVLNLVVFFFLGFFLTACGGGGGESKAGGGTSGGGTNNNFRGALISSKLVGEKNANYLTPYAVKAYKIVYNTIDVNGNKINASGLLAIPQKSRSAKSSLLSYQHGTIFLNRQAPSISQSTTVAIMRFAGTGYVISAADYIGYGESTGQIHPYMHASSLASASVDMLRASKSFLQSKNIHLDNKLFLAGYSEGGYATLALQKSLQENHANEFTVTASAAGAGAYDLSETAKTFANKTRNEKPAYINFILKAYDTIYSLNSVSDMFQPQYVNVVNSVFDGNHSSGTINGKLAKETSELYQANFLEALRGNGEHVLKAKLKLNDIYDWTPTAPTRFFHSPNDEIVPYANSQKAFDTMRANGASHVSLGDCSLNTHVDCALPYLFDTQHFFSRYK